MRALSFWEVLTSKIIIFPRKQRNANNVVTAHLADNPLPFCSFWRLMRLLIQTWDFCKAICSVLQFPCCLNFPLQLHHQDTVSSAVVGQTAVQNVMSCCELCMHTHYSFIKCCVSQKNVESRECFTSYLCFSDTWEKLTIWQKRSNASASGCCVLLQHDQKVN